MTPLVGPKGEPLPEPYRWLVAEGLTRFPPWELIETTEEAARRLAVFERFQRFVPEESKLTLWPFAVRPDIEEVAAFVLEEGRLSGRVVVYEEGWEGYSPSWNTEFEDVWSWLRREVLLRMEEWAEEEDAYVMARIRHTAHNPPL